MDRIAKLLEKLKVNNLDGLLITKMANVNYISRFKDEFAYVLVCKEGNFIITDGRFIEIAEKRCENFKAINWKNSYSSMLQCIDHLCKNYGINSLGFEKENISYALYDKLKSNLSNTTLVPTSNIIEDFRYIKDEEEIELLRKASAITDKAFTEILNFIKPGLSEKAIAAKLEYIIKLNDGDGVGFDTILISGKKTSLPHGKPDNKIIENGDFITMDFGVLYHGYTSDMTRTIVVGKPSEKQVNIYNLVKEAQEAALSTIKAGITAKVPDDKVREILNDHLEYYYPGIGHGVGRELHEEPFISKTASRIIEDHCVITVEPGLYIPNWGGVRIEDTVLVKDEGVEILTKSPKDLLSIKN